MGIYGRGRGDLLQDGGVEFLPVVQVVEVDRSRGDAAVVGETGGGEDAFPSRVIVAIAFDGEVVALDGIVAELLAVLANPCLKRRIGRLEFADECFHRLGVEP